MSNVYDGRGSLYESNSSLWEFGDIPYDPVRAQTLVTLADVNLRLAGDALASRASQVTEARLQLRDMHRVLGGMIDLVQALNKRGGTAIEASPVTFAELEGYALALRCRQAEEAGEPISARVNGLGTYLARRALVVALSGKITQLP